MSPRQFIVSSVPFTTLWQHDALTDSWAGFTHERTALLNVMHTVSNVVVLSGDRHEFAAIEFSPEQRGAHPVFEVSTSPLSMFYIPFVRTLKSESDARVLRARHAVEIDEDGLERVVETEEEVPQEKVLKYIAKGNYKWYVGNLWDDMRRTHSPIIGPPSRSILVIWTSRCSNWSWCPMDGSSTSACFSLLPVKTCINVILQPRDRGCASEAKVVDGAGGVRASELRADHGQDRLEPEQVVLIACTSNA